MGYVSKEYLKENGYMLFRYQKSEDGSEGVLPVNIDDLPEANTQNRKTGEWIYGEDSCGQDGWTCSECGFFVPWCYEYYKNSDFIWKYKTCPCCDAKMISYTGKKGEENEQGH